MQQPPCPPLVRVAEEGGKRALRYSFHPGQMAAWNSTKRIVAVIAGSRGGKSSFGPLWLHREMMTRGPGDYLIAAPSYPLIDKAAGPEVEYVFGRLLKLGELKRSPMRFEISRRGHRLLWGDLAADRPSRIIFGHADDPDSLEAMSAKAAWLDEAGQRRFRLASWEAIWNRRLSFDKGRVLITTTPYDLSWLKQKIHDPWVAAGQNHPDIDVIRFDSTQNPAFPEEEFERAERELPRWKFDLLHRGVFTRPAGLIYDSFDRKLHVRPRCRIPDEWPRYVGLDFGGTNTAAVFFAEELGPDRRPTGKLWAYREYKPGKMDPARIALELRKGEPRLPTFVGGNPQEEEWRARFREAGLPVLEPPTRDVEVGIDNVYGCFARNEILIFDDLSGLLDEVESYSRELDDAGEPTEKIEAKSYFHRLDAARYVLAWYKRGGSLAGFRATRDVSGSLLAHGPPGVFETRDEGRDRDRDTGPFGSGSYGGMRFPDW